MKNKPSRIFKFFILILLLTIFIGTNSGYLLTNAYALNDSLEIGGSANRNQEVANSFFSVYLPLIMKPIPNASPTDISLSNTTVAEGQSVGTEIGTFTTTDPDAGNTFTYQLVSGTGSTDNASFTISGDKLLSSIVFDYETKTSYSIRVRSTDQGSLYFEKCFIVTVTNVNESPTDISLSNTTVPENQSVGTEVGTFSTTDPDAGDTFTYQLVSGTGSTDNASFAISGDKLLSSIVFDYETKTSYNIRVRSTDQGGLYTEKSFTITVTDVEDIPAGVTILPNHSWYVDSIDYLHIVGEVYNNTNNILRFVEINVNIFNGSGGLIDTDFTYTTLENLQPHDKTCFHLFVPLPQDWSYYEFEPVQYWTDGTAAPKLTIYNHSGSYDSYWGWYEILGMVRNDGNVIYDFVQPIATLYNASNTVIGCDFTYSNTYTLDPGQSSAFEITILGRDYSDVASYRLQVDGR